MEAGQPVSDESMGYITNVTHAKKEYARLRRVQKGVKLLGGNTKKVETMIAYIERRWLPNTRGARNEVSK